jgi:hypothetical protein
MRLIFKVAAGVFIGVMAVLVVLAIPKWREHSRATDARRIVALLTPEQVISRCGKPTKDDTLDLGNGFRTRSILYVNPSVTAVNGLRPDTAELIFLASSTVPDWHFTGMETGVNGETRGMVALKNPVEQLGWLPCLAQK